MDISVALGTHNGGRYLREQLASIIAQTVRPSEIVLSDDASTDDTVEIALGMLAEEADISLVVIQNDPALGVTKNFEQAALACTGDLIALCDQDDVWRGDRMATMLAQFEERPDLLLLHSDARLVDSEGRWAGATLFSALEVSETERRLVHGGDAYDALLRRNLATGATTVFRRELLDRALPFPAGWVHDEWLAIIASATGKLDLVDDTLIDYRQHGGNEIGAAKLTLAGKFRRVLAEPRTTRNARLEANFTLLAARLQSLGAIVPEYRLVHALAKVEHERARSSLPVSRWRRIAPIVGRLKVGSYAEYGRGVQDALRDLLQPAR